MIIDTSAVVAILRGEEEATRLRFEMAAAPVLRMSAASVLELSIVVGRQNRTVVDAFLEGARVQILDVDTEQLGWARDAFERYGRGSGSSARLNFGDCLTYGAARSTGEPLLFVGNDFTHTDLELAGLQPY